MHQRICLTTHAYTHIHEPRTHCGSKLPTNAGNDQFPRISHFSAYYFPSVLEDERLCKRIQTGARETERQREEEEKKEEDEDVAGGVTGGYRLRRS